MIKQLLIAINTVRSLRWIDAFWTLIGGFTDCSCCECQSDDGFDFNDWSDDYGTDDQASVVRAPLTFKGKALTPEQVDYALRAEAAEIIQSPSQQIPTAEPPRFRRAVITGWDEGKGESKITTAVYSPETGYVLALSEQSAHQNEQHAASIRRILDNLQYNAQMKVQAEKALKRAQEYKGDMRYAKQEAHAKIERKHQSPEGITTSGDATDRRGPPDAA